MKTAQYLLRLYPRAWRKRYEEEVLAMLEQRPLSFADTLDLLTGACDAHLHPHLGTSGMGCSERMIHMFLTLRRSVLTIFCAYVGMILSGMALQKMTEYDDFQETARTYPLVGLSFNLVVIAAVVALCWLLEVSVGQQRPMRTPPAVSYSLAIPQRKSTISSIDSFIFTEGEWTRCTGFSRSSHA
jgi:hypothetical protein